MVERAFRAEEPPEPESALVLFFVVLREATYDVRDGAVEEPISNYVQTYTLVDEATEALDRRGWGT